MKFWKTRKAFRYYFENLSTIPDILKFKVFDSVGKKIIGSLDQKFVGDHSEAGNVFVLRGLQWRILNIDEKALQVNVEPLKTGQKMCLTGKAVKYQ
uniref:DEAD/DEAH box helicase domain-containing protein (Lhr) n=1 Tax=uncultured marine thaumarchaeote AD1000_44_B05 TaxID=1455917 RepID=A0A075FS83_9ARCH|nr:DEAD/DEAH box helicase domain-containing protein (lhr) [uncultured marine thaumarchaeote AD1000_44_B05]